MELSYWRKCGSCRKEIGFNSIYQVCSVSSCGKFAFCSVDCWNQHNPVMNHKSAWAEERRSPRKEDAVPETAESVRRVLVQPKSGSSSNLPSSSMDQEVLIVASKLKQYIKDKHDMNTSGNVMEILSHIVRREANKAADKARADGRKTVMDRDFE
ncbi:MAG TPA: hypothetical protein VNJ08_09930 [Bacteriovoracaceae bacterium]|nr:hypothetical protein [Bacteriovoracaceae bacterium]